MQGAKMKSYFSQINENLISITTALVAKILGDLKSVPAVCEWGRQMRWGRCKGIGVERGGGNRRNGPRVKSLENELSYIIISSCVLIRANPEQADSILQHGLWKLTNNVMDPEGSYCPGKYALWTSNLAAISSLTTPLPVAITITASTATILTKPIMWNHIERAPVDSYGSAAVLLHTWTGC